MHTGVEQAAQRAAPIDQARIRRRFRSLHQLPKIARNRPPPIAFVLRENDELGGGCRRFGGVEFAIKRITSLIRSVMATRIHNINDIPATGASLRSRTMKTSRPSTPPLTSPTRSESDHFSDARSQVSQDDEVRSTARSSSPRPPLASLSPPVRRPSKSPLPQEDPLPTVLMAPQEAKPGVSATPGLSISYAKRERVKITDSMRKVWNIPKAAVGEEDAAPSSSSAALKGKSPMALTASTLRPSTRPSLPSDTDSESESNKAALAAKTAARRNRMAAKRSAAKEPATSEADLTKMTEEMVQQERTARGTIEQTLTRGLVKGGDREHSPEDVSWMAEVIHEAATSAAVSVLTDPGLIHLIDKERQEMAMAAATDAARVAGVAAEHSISSRAASVADPESPIPNALRDETGTLEVLRVLHSEDHSPTQESSGDSSSSFELRQISPRAEPSDAGSDSAPVPEEIQSKLNELALAQKSETAMGRIGGGLSWASSSLTRVGGSAAGLTRQVGSHVGNALRQPAAAQHAKNLASDMVGLVLPASQKLIVDSAAHLARQASTRLFGESDNSMAWLNIPEQMSLQEGERMVHELKGFYTNYQEPGSFDWRKTADDLRRQAFPVIQRSAVQGAGTFMAGFASDLLGARRAEPRQLSTEQRTRSRPEFDPYHDLSEAERIAHARLVDREDQPAETPAEESSNASRIRPVVATVLADAAQMFGSVVMESALTQSRLLAEPTQDRPSRQIMKQVYDKVKDIYAPHVAARSPTVQAAIKKCDEDVEYYMTSLQMDGIYIENAVQRRLDLAHSNPGIKKPASDFADFKHLPSTDPARYVPEPESVKNNPMYQRVKASLHPDRIRPETADNLITHFYKPLASGKNVVAINVHSRQPGGGKGLFVSELEELLDTPVIPITRRDLLDPHLWMRGSADWGPYSNHLTDAVGAIHASAIKKGRADLILHCDELILSDHDAAPDVQDFKYNTDPMRQLLSMAENCPFRVILVVTSQKASGLEAVNDRLTSIELRVDERQRRHEADKYVEKYTERIVDSRIRNKVKDGMREQMDNIAELGNAMDCGRRLVQRMAEQVLSNIEAFAEGDQEIDHKKVALALLNQARTLATPRPDAAAYFAELERMMLSQGGPNTLEAAIRMKPFQPFAQ